MRLLYLMLIIIAVISCTQEHTVYCQAYNINDLAFGSRHLNDTIIFTNGDTDIKFAITSMEHTPSSSFSYKTGPLQSKHFNDGCKIEGAISAQANASRGGANTMQIVGSDDPGNESYSFNLSLFDLHVSGRTKPHYEIYATRQDTIASMTISGKTYHKVLVAANDTTGPYTNRLIWRVFATDTDGIIGFSDRQTHSDFFIR